jgi:hypothetical protein
VTDAPSEEEVPVEEIPDDARLVRFLSDGEYDTYNGQAVASANALKDPALSVDWLERTTLGDGYRRKPKSKAHAVLVASAARRLEQIVGHRPHAENHSHSQIECPERLQEKGKRRNAVAWLLHGTIIGTGLREA